MTIEAKRLQKGWPKARATLMQFIQEIDKMTSRPRVGPLVGLGRKVSRRK